jgi:lipopolysaccharide export LptBFGC system permease protein LptF
MTLLACQNFFLKLRQKSIKILGICWEKSLGMISKLLPGPYILLSRYLMATLLKSIGLIMGGTLVLMIFFEWLEVQRKYSNAEKNIGIAVDMLSQMEMVFLKIPWLLHLMLPSLIFASVCFSLYLLGRSRELLILRAFGLSVWFVIRTYIWIILPMGLFDLYILQPNAVRLLQNHQQFHTMSGLHGTSDHKSLPEFCFRDSFPGGYIIVQSEGIQGHEWHNINLYFFQNKNFSKNDTSVKNNTTIHSLKSPSKKPFLDKPQLQINHVLQKHIYAKKMFLEEGKIPVFHEVWTLWPNRPPVFHWKTPIPIKLSIKNAYILPQDPKFIPLTELKAFENNLSFAKNLSIQARIEFLYLWSSILWMIAGIFMGCVLFFSNPYNYMISGALAVIGYSMFYFLRELCCALGKGLFINPYVAIFFPLLTLILLSAALLHEQKEF